MPFKRMFEGFCQETTLAGWAQLFHAKNFPMKVFWAFILFIAHACMFILCYFITTDFLQSGTLPVIKTTTGSIKDLEFPAIAFCNDNQIQASFARKTGFFENEQALKLFKSEFMFGKTDNNSFDEKIALQQVKDKLRQHFDWNETKYASDYSAQKCSDMFLYGYWQGNSNLFEGPDAPDLDSISFLSRNDAGTCCYIWMYSIVDTVQVKSSIEYGLHLILDVETYEYFDTSYGSQGFKFWTADPSRKPLVSFSQINLSSGWEYLIEITTTLVNISKEAVFRFKPHERDCHTNSEFGLKHFNISGYFYSMDNCYYNAAIEETIKHCNCSPPYHPTTSLKLKMDICTGNAKACEREQLRTILQGASTTLSPGIDGVIRKCLPACANQHVEAKASAQKYPIRQTFHKRKEICIAFKKILKICQDEHRKATFEEAYGTLITCSSILEANTKDICMNNKYNQSVNPELTSALFTYASENFASAQIYVKNPFYTLITKESHTSLGSFIGNLGGIFGMLLGLTAFGVIELFSYILLSLCQLLKP